MKKYLIFFFLILSCSIASGCTKKILYLTPEATGYLYDSKTKEPLHNVNGYIGFYLPDEKSTTIKVNNDGSFTIKPLIKEYFFIEPSLEDYKNLPPLIYISFKNYQNKTLDYSEKFNEQVPEEKANFEHYKKIDLGKVYLDPE
ncbi:MULTISPECIES: hypothetical protein [Acinetobacter]|jgi:hypothetical protein|uniref:Lipoprotein n=11 Tax=Acinetobacter baumannii TaxID=470 RepID=A0A0M3FGT0_ACIBA|nr:MULTISPECIES: hypothetical protein [Acinetobacter]CAH1081850.1 Uncharacterised protein [Acinetobacter phage MD-2021a]SSW76772.1 Uncharacterised protein [Klebsiella pneumoniae]ARG36929.1 hypothetical protein B7L46_19105 [Acinetobacter baumannii]ASO71267.1 hypothetical protein Aba7804_10930 [Acinetobacter baumannii]AVN29861.1 hypothetical protein AM467_10660 [Acinetobacter baumannii]